jgi:hypothetical protein
MAEKRPRMCVTVSTQRAGTKLLGSCFNKGTLLLSLGEVLHDRSVSPVAFRKFVERGNLAPSKFSTGTVFDLFDEYFAEISHLYRLVHIDVMYANLLFGAPLWWTSPNTFPLLEYFKARNFAVIHLTRDIVDSFLSVMNAQLTGQYHAVAEGDLTHEGAQTVNGLNENQLLHSFSEYRRTTADFRARVRESLVDYPFTCEIDYDSLLNERGYLNLAAKSQITAILPGGEIEQLQVHPTSLVKTAGKHPAIENVVGKLKSLDVH